VAKDASSESEDPDDGQAHFDHNSVRPPHLALTDFGLGVLRSARPAGIHTGRRVKVAFYRRTR